MVGINTFLTIMLLALTTNCDGGALLTIHGTLICLILSPILCGGLVAFMGPNMRRDMVPRSMRRVTSLPPTSKSKKSPVVQNDPYPSQIKPSADVLGAKHPTAAMAKSDGDGGGDSKLGRSEKTSARTSIDGDHGGDSKLGMKEMESIWHR